MSKSITTGTNNTLVGSISGDVLNHRIRKCRTYGYGSLSTDDVGSKSTAVGFDALRKSKLYYCNR